MGIAALMAVCLLIMAAVVGIEIWDRAQTLETAIADTSATADYQVRLARRTLQAATGRLDALAATWPAPSTPGAFQSALKQVLADIPQASFLAAQEGRGQMFQAVPRREVRNFTSPPPASPRSDGREEDGHWSFFDPGALALVRRPDTDSGVLFLMTLRPDWFSTLLFGAEHASSSTSFLVFRQGIIPASPSAETAQPLPADLAALLTALPAAPAADSGRWHIERRSLMPGQLDLVVALDRDTALGAWRARLPVVGMLLALPLLLFGGLGATLLVRQDGPHPGQEATWLAEVAQRLSRLPTPQAIVARAEALGRSLFERDDLVISLFPETVARAPDSPPLSPATPPETPIVQLRELSGRHIGDICLAADPLGFPVPPVPAGRLVLLEPFARVVVSALTAAGLHAEAGAEDSCSAASPAGGAWGILRIDHDWRVLEANPAAREATGKSDPCGQDLRWLLPGLREGLPTSGLWPPTATGRPVRFSIQAASAERRWEIFFLPLAEGAVVCLRDTPGRHDLEERLRQAQKLETVGQLTGGIAHDVNNLLTVILGNLEMLALRAEDRRGGTPVADPDLDTTLAEAALRAGESASQLMHRLLSFSRRQPQRPQTVRVEALLQGLQPMLRRTLNSQVTLSIHWLPGLWAVSVPPSELESALLNLAINAQDAMPAGGGLTIQAENVVVDRVYAAVAGLERTGDYVMLCVADTGTGMAKEVLDHASDPFFTTKAPGKGTGLGLAMVFSFASQNGGHVLIDSEPGAGTAVRLYLPRAEQNTSPARTAPQPEPPGVVGGSESLLLVEDNDQVRQHTEAMLTGLGYHLQVAANGPAALALLDSGFRPDLLIADVILPGSITGRQVAEQALRQLPGLKVLFISGYPGSVLLENGRLPPGMDLLDKPFRRSELARRIRAQLDSPPA